MSEVGLELPNSLKSGFLWALHLFPVKTLQYTYGAERLKWEDLRFYFPAKNQSLLGGTHVSNLCVQTAVIFVIPVYKHKLILCFYAPIKPSNDTPLTLTHPQVAS